MNEQPAAATVEPRYGHQTLVADGGALALLGAGAVTSGTLSDLLVDGAVSTFVLVPTTVHIVHGHVGKGIADMAMRVLTPALGGTVANLVAHPSSLDDATSRRDGATIGGVVGGAAIASAVDAMLLAREAAPVTRSADLTATNGSGVTVRPSLSTKKDGFTAGVVGVF